MRPSHTLLLLLFLLPAIPAYTEEDIARLLYKYIEPTGISFDCMESYIFALINQDMGIIGSLLYTGKYVDNVGSYADCVKPDSGTDYYLYTLTPPQTNNSIPLLDGRDDKHFMGLCVSNVCTR